MGKQKVLFQKETEIWTDPDNNILCGNLCKHLQIKYEFDTFAECELFNKNLYLCYSGKITLGFPRCEGCMELKKL